MIKVTNLKKSYGTLEVYQDFSCEIEENKITAFLGESGCGKTTLLNILAGLIPYDGGEIVGEIKPVSFIFQSDRLLPNLTVSQNLRFVLGDDVDIDTPLKEVGLIEFKDSYIKELSGGMMRRVAILRAFLYPSKSIFMDEPFLNIDLKLKQHLMDMFLNLYGGNKRTVFFVTHDIDEAAYLADRIIVLKEAKIAADINNDKSDGLRDRLKELLLS